ncbi:hypothetical protein ACFRCG_12645 [Embleya sp. NPDC056575]|uniref:hypothetical protein n=1 Tax=unclassified Embleya TaxID=2699296 RepID=UPI003684F26A
MSASTIGRYGELDRVLSPAVVSGHLAAHGWTLEARQAHVKELWRLEDDTGGLTARILLPLATDYEDFRRRFDEALYGIGRVYGWDPETLLEHVSATHADLFYIRLDQSLRDGTISFEQADETLRGIHKMLGAAAMTAADPEHTRSGGRRPAVVREFLTDDVRLGHTKRGSFIFTIVTRLGEPAPAGPPADERPFPRRVMETLARGLETTRDAALSTTRGDAPGMSLGLVESLEDLTKAPGLRALDLSFEWSPVLPSPPAIRHVLMGRDVIGELPRVREGLARREEPPTRQTVVGPVKSLTRENAGTDTQERGTVVLLADIPDKGIRNIHVTLTGENYDWAIRAHRAKLPLTVTGDLTRERRTWRLLGEVTLDTTFLAHVLDRPTHEG